jgi:hypothetical protein
MNVLSATTICKYDMSGIRQNQFTPKGMMTHGSEGSNRTDAVIGGTIEPKLQ